MSLRQKAETLRRTIDNLLAAGGDTAPVPILKVVNATANWCPPLKMASGSALTILDEVKKLKESEKEWADFGQYVVDMVAEVVSSITSYDTSVKEANPWMENVEELNELDLFLVVFDIVLTSSPSALQKIKSEIEGREKVEKRSTIRKTDSHLRNPGRIDGLKKDFDKALTSFQLRTNLIAGAKLAAIERRLREDEILDSLLVPSTTQDNPAQACLEGTRVDLIERIMTWCRNTGESENRLMQLTAVAGAGKTSIALTIAERCASEGDITLLMHFSFKAGERSRLDFLFSGIARALAGHDPVYRTFITSALRDDPSLSTASFGTQFMKLVASPLLHKPPPADCPMVIIIDALDECDDGLFVPLAGILRDEVPRLPSSVKFFIISRQFELVKRSLSTYYPIDRLVIDLWDATNVQDCATYTRFQLQKLKEEHPYLRHKFQDERTVQGISERAGGLFIWISTIFWYIRMVDKDPMGTLEGLLGTGTKRSAVSAEGMMDRLYTSILKKCSWEDEDFARDYPVVMGAIFVAQQPLSILAWDAILSPFLSSSVQYTLAELASLISGVEDFHIPIRVLHQSFREFIVDRVDPQSINPGCSLVNMQMMNDAIALRCGEILNRDLDFLEGLGLIENLSKQDELPRIPPEELSEHLHYACRHIVYHLNGIEESSQWSDELAGIFLSQRATRWVEACVRMEGYISISTLPEWAMLAGYQRSKDGIRTLAKVLIQLQSNLEFFSRLEESYEAANDSVVLCRYLTSMDSESYTPDLAKSLNTLCTALLKLGRYSEALPTIKESVKLYHQLVAIDPGLYAPKLATSLNNLRTTLSHLGRDSEKLI
ncbi:uncharacterized protein EI90DRAFT_3155597 [Cantharellus anzutake]|uniref:uncharacterized protein n=1 Tax=Cantharellus anzutake TaxID=1750568 RepID=UPI0019063C85|nr:uncharacterized protein EI90DRAFT_3155597 [Cantharellus anzutake]KAF8328874.1 hypothetical protein EI90DRAFT_3155597 [Cantharellus anzutake]